MAPPLDMGQRRLEIKQKARDSKSTMLEPNSKYCVKHAYFIGENSTCFEFRSNLFRDLNVLVLRYAKMHSALRKMHCALRRMQNAEFCVCCSKMDSAFRQMDSV